MFYIGISSEYNKNFLDIPLWNRNVYHVPYFPSDMNGWMFAYVFSEIDTTINPDFSSMHFSVNVNHCVVKEIMSFHSFLMTLDSTTLIDILKSNPRWIQWLEKRSDYVQLCWSMIMHNSINLRYISNPTKDMCLLAVSKNGETIRFVRYTTEGMRLLAVERTPMALQYIDNPSNEVILTALRRNWKAITCIKHGAQTLEHAQIAYAQNPKACFYIKKKFIPLLDDYSATIFV